MDRAAFLLERDAIQARMEARRQAVLADIAERKNGVMPRLLRTGTSLLLGFGGQGESLGWISSLLWAVVAPVAVGVAQRGGDALIQKVIHGIFPGRNDKQTSK